jgi:hypothetical protein
MRPTLLLLPLLVAASEPVVIRSFPICGSEEVDPASTELHVTFDQPMRDGSWSWVTTDHGPFPETTAKARFLEDGRTCVLGVSLQPNTTYVIGINYGRFNNFANPGGERALPWLLRFTTGAKAFDDARAQELAQQIGADLDSGAIGLVVQRFDPAMAKAVSPQQLTEVWRQVQAAGATTTWGAPTCTRQGRLRVVELPFTRGATRFTLRASFDSSARIAGLFVTPAKP